MTEPALIIINALIAVIGLFVAIIYLKSKIFHSYPYYFNLFFILTVLLNNLIRLIPKREEENEYETSIQCYIQGITLTVLDKLMLCQITSYSVIYFLGIFYPDFFDKNKMIIFFTLSEIGFIISLVLATVFSIQGMSCGSQYCYVKTRNNIKFIIDTSVTSILWLISLYCTLRLLINLVKLKRTHNYNNQQADSISYHTFRFSFNLVFNIVMYLYVVLLINKKLEFRINFQKDMFYILLSLIGEIFFTVNIEVIRETKRILTCGQPPLINSNDDERSMPLSEEEEMNDKKNYN